MLLGIAGSLVHYRAACRYGMEEHLAETVGVSYAIGLFLQFLENNLIHNAAVEAVILTVAFWALLFLVEKRKVAESLMEPISWTASVFCFCQKHTQNLHK